MNVNLGEHNVSGDKNHLPPYLVRPRLTGFQSAYAAVLILCSPKFIFFSVTVFTALSAMFIRRLGGVVPPCSTTPENCILADSVLPAISIMFFAL